MATATNDKPVKLGDLPVIKTNILENARQYDKGIIGGYNGTFPLTAATKGNIYLLPATNKFYMCVTNYNGSNLTAPNANFEELSVWANRDKLGNLHQNFNYRSYLEINNNYINRIFNANVINNILILSFDLKQNISLTIGEYLFKNISIDFDFSIFFTSKVFEDLKTNIRISVQPRTISIDSFVGEGFTTGIASYFVLFIPLKLNINKK